MTISEALMKIEIDEDLVEIRKKESGKYTVTLIVETGDGFVTGEVIGEADSPMAGIVLVSDRYYGNTPRLVSASEDLFLCALNREKVEKFLCHVYYAYGSGHSRHEIRAENPNKAFDSLLVKIKEDVGAEDERQPRPLAERVSEIVIEAARPLNLGQHPDTPMLWRTVAHWKAVRKIVTEWEPQITDEDVKASEELAAQAFSSGATEFVGTGTVVPANFCS